MAEFDCASDDCLCRSCVRARLEHREVMREQATPRPSAPAGTRPVGEPRAVPVAPATRDSAEILRCPPTPPRLDAPPVGEAALDAELAWWRGQKWGDRGLRLHAEALIAHVERLRVALAQATSDRDEEQRSRIAEVEHWVRRYRELEQWRIATAQRAVAAEQRAAHVQDATWQPIETAPKDGRIVLLVEGPSRRVWSARYIGSKHGRMRIGWFTDSRLPIVSPTHWMPLPQPPQMEQRAAAQGGDVP